MCYCAQSPVLLASSKGGINIEEVAHENPSWILREPVDILAGIKDDQIVKVAKFMGFEGDRVDQVRDISNKYLKFSLQFDGHLKVQVLAHPNAFSSN